MKRYGLPLLCCFLSAIAAAQGNRLDSLLKALNGQKDDTTKVRTLHLLSSESRRQGNATTAIRYANEAVALSDRLRFHAGKGAAYLELGFTNTMQQKHAEAGRWYAMANRSFAEAGDKRGIATSLLYAGQAYHSQKQYADALKSYADAARLFESTNNKYGIAHCYRWMGLTRSAMENSAEALKYQYKSLRIYEQLGDKRNIASCRNNIGWSHQMQGDFFEALENMKQSLATWQEIGDQVEIVRLNNLVGSLYFITNNYENALEKHLQALQIARKIQKPSWVLSMTLARLGGDYEALADRAARYGEEEKSKKMFAEAVHDYDEAMKLHKENSNLLGMADVFWHFGSINTKLKNYDSARNYFTKALQLYKEVGFKPFIGLSYESLSKLDSLEGNFQKAYEHYKLAITYRDSIFNDETVRKAAKAKMQYEFDKMEDSLRLDQLLVNEKLKQQRLLAVQQQQKFEIEAALLQLSDQQKELNRLAFLKAQAQLEIEQSSRRQKDEQLQVLTKEKALEQANVKLKITELSLKEKEVRERKMERNTLVAGAIAVFILGVAFYTNRANRLRTYNLQEKQKMRAQIARDLHDDIGSELTGISLCTEMVKMQLPTEKDEVKSMLDLIANNARTIVSTMSDIVWLINPENDITENLIRRIRSHGIAMCEKRNIHCEFHIDSENENLQLNMVQRKNLYLIYKEAIHNAVKYADCSKIHVSLFQRENQLELAIVDNGSGFDSTKPAAGNGLNNMKRRAEEVNGVLDLHSYPGTGTVITLKLKIT